MASSEASIKDYIGLVANAGSLSETDARDAFDILMTGGATPAQIGAFLMALRVRGETVDEISGAVSSMRDKMLRVDAPDNAIDIVGTGGDGLGSVNVSTCSAFVVAGAGVPVAKHGNRALSSKSGAADVLTALGVNIDIGPNQISTCIREAGLGFMFAPSHHPAMKHVGAARVELATRTVFNLLGPLSNPAGVKRQMVGVFAEQWVEPLAHVLNRLGSQRAWVVHGQDGLDEITTTTKTKVSSLENGSVETFEISPQDAGLPTADMKDLIGGDASENAVALRAVLEGKPSAYRDIVLMNAGAGLLVAGKANTLAECVTHARDAIDNGSAMQRLDKLVSVSNAV